MRSFLLLLIGLNIMIEKENNQKNNEPNVKKRNPWLFAAAIALFLVLAFFAYKNGFFDDLINEPDYGIGDGNLYMYTIDVGQGDCILLVSPNGKTMLVDVGESSSYTAVSDFLHDRGIEGLDIVVGSHPHSDHVGAMGKLLNEFGADLLLLPEVDNRTNNALISIADGLNIDWEYVWNNSEIDWDRDCTVTVLAPVCGASYSESDMNEWSIILRVEYGENAIILTGDAEVHSEQLAMFANDSELFEADVLKIGHHGSSSSTGDSFLEAVNPEYAILSLGKDNRYGHPHWETIEKLDNTNITYFRTDECGTIVAVLTGSTCTVHPFGGD